MTCFGCLYYSKFLIPTITMDPLGVLGVTASVIACIQLSESILKRVGPSKFDVKDLKKVQMSLYSFRGAYESLKLHLQLNEEDEARLSALQHLRTPLEDCKYALELIEKRLKNSTFLGKYVIGKIWDGKMQRCLQRLEEGKALFELTLQADQQ
jgi:hypothetical protein